MSPRPAMPGISGYALGRRQLVLAAPAALAFPAAIATAASDRPLPRYEVRLVGLSPPRFAIAADLPVFGSDLRMDSTYPAELPAMAARGWPALISGLAITDEHDRPIPIAAAGSNGWRLERPATGRIRAQYVVDFGIFQDAGWPSPLESAIADANAIAVAARGLFLFSDQASPVEVRFYAPRGWRAVAPWPRHGARRYRAGSGRDLVDNFIVFSREEPDLAVASGFRMQISAMGHWQPLRPLVRRVLQAVVTRQVAMMGFTAAEAYNVVLTPVRDRGGQAYRQSLVFAHQAPSAQNVAEWANLLAHELFHYWNYARLSGADYSSTQWFQEGFTEYVANLTLVTGKVVPPEALLAKLGGHVANYRKLSTTLEDIGGRKGPPLYSAGALVAFSFDVMIRSATNGAKDIGAFFRNLWLRTRAGDQKYAWTDIERALAETAPVDWQAYYLRHIRGREPLPLEAAVALAGLKLGVTADGSPQVTRDPAAPLEARQLWSSLVGSSG